MASVRDLATRVSTGSLSLDRVERLPDERVIELLTEVRGIGRWTAEMLLIFDLGRPDVLPASDLGIKKGLQQVHGLRALPDAAVIEKRAEPWRPFRSIGSWYLWRALDATPA
jgi:3-methyladenine DNA glycosylase/8-oxoguanine DNA glycosylase